MMKNFSGPEKSESPKEGKIIKFPERRRLELVAAEKKEEILNEPLALANKILDLEEELAIMEGAIEEKPEETKKKKIKPTKDTTSKDTAKPVTEEKLDEFRILRDELEEEIEKLQQEYELFFAALSGDEKLELKKLTTDLESSRRSLGHLVPEKKLKKEIADLALARELLGEKNIFGPEQIETALGISVTEVPPITYSRRDLEKAKELGEMLILRVDKDNGGHSLTAERLSELAIQNINAVKKKKLFEGQKYVGASRLEDDCWYKNESFFTNDIETPRLEWKLVSKNIIPHTIHHNYKEQTIVLRNYLQHHGLASQQEIAECSAEKLNEISALISAGNEQEAARQLAELQINKNHRRTLVEAAYDTLVVFGGSGEGLLEKNKDWTNSRSASGRFVDFGHFGPPVHVYHWPPNFSSANLGVVSAR